MTYCVISQGLTRPAKKNFAKHGESRTAEVAAKPEIINQAFSTTLLSTRPNRSPTVALSRDEHKSFRELVFQP